jgi:hypothetical protein
LSGAGAGAGAGAVLGFLFCAHSAGEMHSAIANASTIASGRLRISRHLDHEFRYILMSFNWGNHTPVAFRSVKTNHALFQVTRLRSVEEKPIHKTLLTAR